MMLSNYTCTNRDQSFECPLIYQICKKQKMIPFFFPFSFLHQTEFLRQLRKKEAHIFCWTLELQILNLYIPDRSRPLYSPFDHILAIRILPLTNVLWLFTISTHKLYPFRIKCVNLFSSYEWELYHPPKLFI